jgi:hypothetical protein
MSATSLCPRHRQPGSPRRLAEAIAKPNQPVTARRETLAERRMRPTFVSLWFGWALKTGHKGGQFELFPGDCRNSQTRWRREGDLNSRDPSAFDRRDLARVWDTAMPARDPRTANARTTSRESRVSNPSIAGILGEPRPRWPNRERLSRPQACDDEPSLTFALRHSEYSTERSDVRVLSGIPA